MDVPHLHDWDLPYEEARRLQDRLAERICLEPPSCKFERIAGADVAFSRDKKTAFAALVLVRRGRTETLEQVTASCPLTFPYIPGLLTFREGPVLVEAFRTLGTRPDAVIFDGQGLAHPRRMGLACHMGLWLGLPTVGCAKSRLIGEHSEPEPTKGSRVPLLHEGDRIGTVLRTRDNVKPVYVSPGHLIDLTTSERLVLDCCTRYRLPEPTRLAHLAVSKAKRRQAGA